MLFINKNLDSFFSPFYFATLIRFLILLIIMGVLLHDLFICPVSWFVDFIPKLNEFLIMLTCSC